MKLKNEKVMESAFLKEMYEDQFFPNKIVDKGKSILIHLCLEIEIKKPKTLKSFTS